jgi:copper chaperone
MDRITMKIDGMSCGHCVSSVDKALKKIDGVKVESVGIGNATVSYDPSAVSAEQIADAVADEGYAVVETTR